MVAVIPYSRFTEQDLVQLNGPNITYIDKPPCSVPLSKQLTESNNATEQQLTIGNSSLLKNQLQEVISDRETDHEDSSRQSSVSPIPPLLKANAAVKPSSPLPAILSEKENDNSEEVARETVSTMSLENPELLVNADTTIYDIEKLEELEGGECETKSRRQIENIVISNVGEKVKTFTADDALPSLWRDTDTSSDSSSDEADVNSFTNGVEGSNNDRDTFKVSNETWWADAMAESEMVTDDMDALVERLEEDPDKLNPSPLAAQDDKQEEQTKNGAKGMKVSMDQSSLSVGEDTGVKLTANHTDNSTIKPKGKVVVSHYLIPTV